MVTYEEYTNNFNQVFIKKIEDNFITFIPKDNSNSDYQAYLDKDKPQVEHLTEIPTKGAYEATLVTESAPTA